MNDPNTTQRPAELDADRALAAVERLAKATRDLTAKTVAAAQAQRELDLARMAYSVAESNARAAALQSKFPNGWRSLLHAGGRFWEGNAIEQPQLEVARRGLLRHLDNAEMRPELLDEETR